MNLHRRLSSRLHPRPTSRLLVRLAAATTASAIGMALAIGAAMPAASAASARVIQENSLKQSDKSLVNEQLVVASLNPSGLPEKSELINRIVATGFDQQNVAVDTSTNRLRYLDKNGAPEMDGQKVLYPVGGEPQTTVTTIADFEKPLPIALHAEYATPNGGQRGVNPDDIPGKEGDLDITYTVTNTTVKREEVSFQTADGSPESKELPVFSPFVGVLQATLPANLKVTNSGDAVVGTSQTGETTLTWNLVLYPPIGNYEQRLNFSVNSSQLSIPGVTMEVMPISNDQSPATAFTSKLLTESVKGSQGMAAGLNEINAAVVGLGGGASQLANGANQLANGGSALANGIGTARQGARGLTTGADDLTRGLNRLAGGLDQLAGPQGIYAAAEGAEEIAAAVKQIAKRVGGPWNKPLPDPLPDPIPKDVTLYQILELLQRGSKVVARLSGEVAEAVAEGAVEADQIAADAKTAKEDADEAAQLLDTVIQSLCPGAAECADLEAAKAKIESAGTSAGDAETKAGALNGKLLTASGKAVIVAAATELTHLLMPRVLDQVTALSLALDARDPKKVGIYESLMALRGALLRASYAADKLAIGADGAVYGSSMLARGVGQLGNGLSGLQGGANQLTSGANQLAGGANQLAGGASQLSSEGTERMINEIVEASQQSGLADAYLEAASARANESAPYPTPEGGISHVSYVYSMAPVSEGGNSAAGPFGILGVVAAGGGILAYRRIRTAP